MGNDPHVGAVKRRDASPFRLYTAGALAFVAVLMAMVAVAGAEPPGVGTQGWFHTDCAFSHRLPDDPIVVPRRPGHSHRHDFLGARSTTAFSTNASLRRGRTACVRDDEVKKWRPDGSLRARFRSADRSAYWVPTLYVHGRPVEPSLTAGYKVGRRAYAEIRPFPRNLRMIAGDALGTRPQIVNGQRVWLWRCPGGKLRHQSRKPARAPYCKAPSLTLDITFPDCWDGHSSDSVDHKAHMAYARSNGVSEVCPATHPVLVPRLHLILRYPTRGGPSTRLASGRINTAHADFMNGWRQDRLAQLVDDCLNADEYCGGTSAPVPGH